MLKWLVSVDGSESSVRAVTHLIDKMQWFKQPIEIHLLNVQHPMPYGNRVTSAIGQDKVAQYHHDEGISALKPTRDKLDAAGIKYVFHIGVGDAARPSSITPGKSSVTRSSWGRAVWVQCPA